MPSIADGASTACATGSQWPWLTSPMQATSPEVARAGASQQPSPVLVSSGGANNSVCSLRVHSSSWPCPRYSEQLAARSHRLCVRPAPADLQGQTQGELWTRRKFAKCTYGSWRRQPEMVVCKPCRYDGDRASMWRLCVRASACVCDVHAWMRRAVWAMAERVGLREDQSFVGQLRQASCNPASTFSILWIPSSGIQ
jgi:hypothetical protein